LPIAIRRHTGTDGNTMQHATQIDDAVCVNAAVEINVLNCPGLKAGKHALASVGFITQCAPCILGRFLADNWSRAWCRPLPTTPMTIVPLPAPTLPDNDGRQ